MSSCSVIIKISDMEIFHYDHQDTLLTLHLCLDILNKSCNHPLASSRIFAIPTTNIIDINDNID